MQVSFNSNIYNKTSFKAAEQKTSTSRKKYTEKQILTAKTKKAISECVVVTLGVSILYFAFKRKFKIDKAIRLEEAAKQLKENHDKHTQKNREAFLANMKSLKSLLNKAEP